MALTGTAADNPDQRIAEDVNRFNRRGRGRLRHLFFTILLISTLSSVVSYSFSCGVFPRSSHSLCPGRRAAGMVVLVALIYALGGTLATHWIGRPLTG